MNQEIFVRQWGAPEIATTLKNLEKFFRLDFLPSSSNTFESDPTTVWIYEKMDRFVLFRKGKLIAHFKWSELKEKSKKPKGEIDSSEGANPPSLIATTLSMFA
jgi:hypothetical protein